MFFRQQLPVLLLLSFISGACTVKEDRDSCPCYLTLHFRDVRRGDLSWYVFVPPSEIHAGTFEEGSSPGEICLPVARRERGVVVVASGEGYETDEGLEIELGDDCPELWMSRDTVDTRNDETMCCVRLHKEYALATIRLLSESSAGLRYDLSGDVCGYYPDGTLRPGSFVVSFPPEEVHRELSARIPRQKDNSLRLNVYESPTLVRSFPIGEILAAGGYDWSAIDLEDFVISLDYVSGRITLSTDLWTETVSYVLEL